MVFIEFVTFEVDSIADLEDSLEEVIEADLGVGVTISATIPENDEYASIETMYYFLDRSYNSSQIITAISDRFITNKDSSGGGLTLAWPALSPVKTIPLVRIVDVWGNAFRYSYTVGASFPVIISAGKDGFYGTPDDIFNFEKK